MVAKSLRAKTGLVSLDAGASVCPRYSVTNFALTDRSWGNLSQRMSIAVAAWRSSPGRSHSALCMSPGHCCRTCLAARQVELRFRKVLISVMWPMMRAMTSEFLNISCISSPGEGNVLGLADFLPGHILGFRGLDVFGEYVSILKNLSIKVVTLDKSVRNFDRVGREGKN